MRTLSLFFVLCAMLSTGCLPMEPQWLPDSSGLVYTKPGEKGDLKHLDLQNKRHRVVATIPNCVTSPARRKPERRSLRGHQES